MLKKPGSYSGIGVGMKDDMSGDGLRPNEERSVRLMIRVVTSWLTYCSICYFCDLLSSSCCQLGVQFDQEGCSDKKSLVEYISRKRENVALVRI